MKLDKYTVGKRYSKALFELAIEKKQEDQIYQELLVLREIYHQVPHLGAILSDDHLEPYEKEKIFAPLLSALDGMTKNFIQVVYRYNRMNDLEFMIDEFEHRYDEYKRVLLGTALTAVPLTKEQHRQIEQKAADLLGYKKANLINLIDPHVVGGVIIEANHKVIDGSIHKQLENIRNSLLK